MTNVLLIDDDLKMGDLLSQYFSKYDIHLTHCAHPHEGIEAVKTNTHELVILDLMMPDMDGFEVCKQVRTFSQIPIIMLTARGEVTDRIVGLEIGADDYLSKPFEPRELVARINNIIKRTQHKPTNNVNSGELNHGHLLINFSTEQVSIENKNIKLTSKEYALLKMLTSQPNTPMSRDEIINQLSGIDAELFSRSVDILVSRLRTKLKPLDCIKTVWNRGYSYVPPE